jgi:hypothetical protein
MRLRVVGGVGVALMATGLVMMLAHVGSDETTTRHVWDRSGDLLR